MKKSTATTFIAIVFILALAVCASLQAAEGEVVIAPHTGILVHDGVDLDDVSLLAGLHADWDIDESFNLRLGYEYTKADVTDGSNLKMSRMPFMFISELHRAAPFKNFYWGLGAVHVSGHYSDAHYPDVNALGPAALLGVKINRKVNVETAWNQLKKYGRNYGGISLIVTCDLF